MCVVFSFWVCVLFFVLGISRYGVYGRSYLTAGTAGEYGTAP